MRLWRVSPLDAFGWRWDKQELINTRHLPGYKMIEMPNNQEKSCRLKPKSIPSSAFGCLKGSPNIGPVGPSMLRFTPFASDSSDPKRPSSLDLRRSPRSTAVESGRTCEATGPQRHQATPGQLARQALCQVSKPGRKTATYRDK